MNFDEYKSRKRKDHSSQNFALANKIAINLLNEEKETKLSMTHKKLKASYDIEYVKRLINFDE
jgi:hypothetical protein